MYTKQVKNRDILPESEVQKLMERFFAVSKKQRVYMQKKKKKYEQTFATIYNALDSAAVVLFYNIE